MHYAYILIFIVLKLPEYTVCEPLDVKGKDQI